MLGGWINRSLKTNLLINNPEQGASLAFERELSTILWDRERHLRFPANGGPAWFEDTSVLRNQVARR